MGIEVRDASSGTAVAVDDGNRMLIKEKSDYEIALENGDAYSWHASGDMAAALTEILAVQNLSKTRNLHIKKVSINNSGDNNSTYAVYLPGTTTPTGTTDVGKPLNTAVTNVADALAYQKETNNDITQPTIIAEVSLPIFTSAVIEHRDGSDICILGPSQNIAVHQVVDTNLSSCEIIGYFKDAA